MESGLVISGNHLEDDDCIDGQMGVYKITFADNTRD